MMPHHANLCMPNNLCVRDLQACHTLHRPRLSCHTRILRVAVYCVFCSFLCLFRAKTSRRAFCGFEGRKQPCAMLSKLIPLRWRRGSQICCIVLLIPLYQRPQHVSCHLHVICILLPLTNGGFVQLLPHLHVMSPNSYSSSPDKEQC